MSAVMEAGSRRGVDRARPDGSDGSEPPEDGGAACATLVDAAPAPEGEPPALERTACPVCGDDRGSPTRYGQGDLRVVRCARCRAAYLSPRLPEPRMLELYRDAAYFEGEGPGYRSYREQGPSLRRTFRRLVASLVDRGLAGGSLLEVGCGYGYFLEAAREHFDFRVGTEMSGKAAARARRRADRIHVGGVAGVPRDDRFDLIVALHVLEHVYDPRPFVGSLVRHLRPGGTLLLATPDMGSPWRRVLGSRWPSFKYPEHVVYYDERALRTLLAGFPDLSRPNRLPYPHAFPLAEVLGKVGFRPPRSVADLPVWIPGTTVAVWCRRART